MTFPKLKTGVVMQYPGSRELSFSTGTLTFLDGGVQAYRDLSTPRKAWRIALSRLDESELRDVTLFFEGNSGSSGVFEFEDPFSGSTETQCRFLEDELPTAIDGEHQGSAELTVVTVK